MVENSELDKKSLKLIKPTNHPTVISVYKGKEIENKRL